MMPREILREKSGQNSARNSARKIRAKNPQILREILWKFWEILRNSEKKFCANSAKFCKILRENSAKNLGNSEKILREKSAMAPTKNIFRGGTEGGVPEDA